MDTECGINHNQCKIKLFPELINVFLFGAKYSIVIAKYIFFFFFHLKYVLSHYRNIWSFVGYFQTTMKSY